jgi:hypothetical protein
MPSADEFLTFLLQGPTKMQADIRDGFGHPIRTIYKHLPTKEIDYVGSLGRNLVYLTQCHFHAKPP